MASYFKISRLKIVRPFCNAHIALPITLLICAVYLLLGRSCEPGSGATEAAFTTVVVCLAGWLAHLRVGALCHWSAVLSLARETLGDLLKFALAVLLVSVVFSLLPVVVDCDTPRTYVSVLITLASDPKAEIAERYASRHTLTNIGEGLSMNSVRPGDKAWITGDGAIVLFSTRAGAMVMLTPTVGPNGLIWHCAGAPEKHIPSICRHA